MTSKIAQEGVNTGGKEKKIKGKYTIRQTTIKNSTYFKYVIYRVEASTH